MDVCFPMQKVEYVRNPLFMRVSAHSGSSGDLLETRKAPVTVEGGFVWRCNVLDCRSRGDTNPALYRVSIHRTLGNLIPAELMWPI